MSQSNSMSEQQELEQLKLWLRVNPNCDLNEQDGQRNTRLQNALQKNQLEIARFLLRTGADINGGAGSMPPLMYAAQYGLLDRLTFLLAEGAPVNYTPDAYRVTALRLAMEFKQPEAVRILLAHGADPNFKDKDGTTPMSYVDKYDEGFILSMIAAGGDPRVRLYHDATLLHFAASRGYRQLAEVCVERGLDPNAKAENGMTPLHHAASVGDTEMVEFLMANGARPQDVVKHDGHGHGRGCVTAIFFVAIASYVFARLM